MDKDIYKEPWSVYIVECSDGTLYVGIARDVVKRIHGHNTTNWCRYTRTRKPVTLRYSEEFRDHAAAWKRERALKRLPRKRKLALIGQNADVL